MRKRLRWDQKKHLPKPPFGPKRVAYCNNPRARVFFANIPFAMTESDGQRLCKACERAFGNAMEPKGVQP